ncbi:MAG TPA: hypothetical protein VMY42_13010 [Thermoguttaceae bacterium]|nr:hypothetical protein [Thermoguttaceae bacterium]
MKSQKQDFARNVLISRRHWDIPLRVGLRPYFRFTCWLDEELRGLVARWAHTAAPNATRLKRRRM